MIKISEYIKNDNTCSAVYTYFNNWPSDSKTFPKWF